MFSNIKELIIFITMQKQKQFSEEEKDAETLSLNSEKGFINEPAEEWPQWSVEG